MAHFTQKSGQQVGIEDGVRIQECAEVTAIYHRAGVFGKRLHTNQIFRLVPFVDILQTSHSRIR